MAASAVMKPPHRKPNTYLSPNDEPGTELTCAGLYTVCGQCSLGLRPNETTQTTLPPASRQRPPPLTGAYIANVIFVNVALLLVGHHGTVVTPASATVTVDHNNVGRWGLSFQTAQRNN